MSCHSLSPLRRLFALSAVAIFTIANAQTADVGRPDFSGSYRLTGAKGAFKVNKAAPWLLRVVQTGADIEITKVAEGKTTTNRCKLDSTALPYTTEGGAKGTCKGQFKGKTMVLETDVTSQTPKSPSVQMRTKQQWTLSSDQKTLTIRNDVELPKSDLGGFQPIRPWSEIYTKI
jgi:hypothetical protein